MDIEIISSLLGSFTPLTNFEDSDRLEKKDNVQFLVELSKEIPVGVYPFRVRSDQGLSNALLFSIGVLPEISEEESQRPIAQAINNSLNQSQFVKAPVTVNGTLSGPDRDFTAQARWGASPAAGRGSSHEDCPDRPPRRKRAAQIIWRDGAYRILYHRGTGPFADTSAAPPGFVEANRIG